MPPARNSQPITFTVLVRISFRTGSASGIMPTPRGFTGPITKSGDTPQGPSRSSRWPRLRVSKPTSPYRRPARITRSKKRDWFAASARSVTAAGTMTPRSDFALNVEHSRSMRGITRDARSAAMPLGSRFRATARAGRGGRRAKDERQILVELRQRLAHVVRGRHDQRLGAHPHGLDERHRERLRLLEARRHLELPVARGPHRLVERRHGEQEPRHLGHDAPHDFTSRSTPSAWMLWRTASTARATPAARGTDSALPTNASPERSLRKPSTTGAPE